MKRILIASAAFAALTGAAFAQQAPVVQGDYSANVLQTYDHEADNNGAGLMIGGLGKEMRASARAVFNGDSVQLKSGQLKSGGITGDKADQEDNRGR